MPGAAGTLGVVHYLGLGAAVALFAMGMAVLWIARHRGDENEQSTLPLLGKVGNPTCLTIGVCLLVCGYHAASYSLLPVVTLVSVPIDRWWLVGVVCGIAMGGSFLADRLETERSEI